jgi:aspartyl-tRNA(Asn)/glutamyl-tRNA(Gln) amidotransferase subunit C
MKIDANEVAHVAALARLRLDEEQTGKLTGQLNDILSAMDKLNQLDTSGVPSTHHASDNRPPMRPDVVEPSQPVEEGLANAPESDGRSFVVPKVI